MPHALFLSTAIPPFAQSHTIRNVFLLQGLHRAGFTLDVVAPSSHGGGDASLLPLMPPSNVIRTDSPPIDALQARLGTSAAAKIFRWCIGVWSNFFAIPDQQQGWERLAIAATYAQAGTRPDVVIASSGSYTAHLAGVQLANHFGVPFVADLGDPWTHNPIWPATMRYRIKRNAPLEQRSVAKATLMTVTTEETAQRYRSWFGAKGPAVEVLPMGFNSADFPAAAPSTAGGIGFSYVGVAYRTGRDLTPLLEAVGRSAGAGVRLKIIGPHSRSFVALTRRLGYSNIAFHPRVSYAQSIVEIAAADVLVVIGNPGLEQIPGKVFMYLAAGKPILLISQNVLDQDPTWRLLRGFPGTLGVEHNPQAIAGAVTSIVNGYPQLAAAAAARTAMPELQRYEWSNLGDRFAQLVRSSLGVPERRVGNQTAMSESRR